MKIAIDLTSLSYHMTGIERYAACVSEQMLIQDDKNEYCLLFRNSVYPVFTKYIDGERVKSVILSGDNKLLFFQIILSRALNRIDADKYLFFAFTSPILFRKKGIINTIHDMGAWDSSESMKMLQKFYWQTNIKCSASVSEKIITVSNFSKGRISKILKFPDEKIHVINSAVYEGVTKDYGIPFEKIKEKYKLPDKYILTLSTLEPRKNMVLLLEAFSRVKNDCGYNLVLVGRKGWKMDEVIDKYNKDGRIHITGFVDDEHISVIYKNAMCFVFPSLYEGFGLPPIEALSLGTPVISSDAASMPEILRKQATFFKSNDIKALEKLLINLEDNLTNMPHELDEFQKEQYRFDVSAGKILEILERD